MNVNERRDYQKYYVSGGEKGFSPKRNEFIIEQSIKRAESMRKRKKKLYEENIKERVDAAADYVMYLERGGTNPAEKYFGRKMLAYLRGEKIFKEMMDRKTGLFKLKSS